MSAEEAYTNFTTPCVLFDAVLFELHTKMRAHSVFGTEVVYDCPNELLVQQKKFMKVSRQLQS